MASWLGQYCINVTDLERTVAFYEALGLECASRTEIDQAWEAVIAHPGGGSRLQLAQQKDQVGPLHHGTAFWKLYVNTYDVAATYAAALAAGATRVSPPERMERWPVTIAFVRDPDDYLVELVERHPWPEGVPAGAPWLGQYCVNVSDLEAGIAFFELLGIECTSRTEIDHAREAIVENPARGSKIQLAQQKDQEGPIDMGSVWKLYVNTDDCQALYDAATGAGYASVMEPTPLDRWPVVVAFVTGPDGYLVEFVEKHAT